MNSLHTRYALVFRDNALVLHDHTRVVLVNGVRVISTRFVVVSLVNVLGNALVNTLVNILDVPTVR